MGFKCAAYGCRSGYDTRNDQAQCTTDSAKITFHGFPLNDKELCDKWVRANPRKDFTPTKYSKLCSLHFKQSDFIEERRDSNVQRRKSLDSKLSRRHLKEGVVPSIFPNAPDYLSTHSGIPRPTSKATSSSRREQEANELDRLEKSFVAEDDISDLSAADLKCRLEAETTAPQGFTMTLLDETLFIYLMDVTEDVPKITACITVKNDHTVVSSLHDKKVPATQFKDLIKDQLKRMSQLINLMARVKSWSEMPQTRSLELQLELAVQCLKPCLDNVDDESEKNRMIKFLIEQLKLIAKPKYGRQYSSQLTIFAYMIYAAFISLWHFTR